jgi:hypothetical protein
MSESTIVSQEHLCDFCRPTKTVAKYDAKSSMGPWGFMCERHFKQHGIGLGTGRGQKLIYDSSELKANRRIP